MMAEEKKQRRIDQIDGRTVLFLTLCACIVTFFCNKFFRAWDFYLLDFFDPLLVRLI